MTFFREEAVQAQQEALLGSVILRSTNLMWSLAGIVGLMCIALVGLLFLGTYTNRATLSGYVVPMEGITRVLPSAPGIVAEVRVRENDEVVKGQALIRLQSERHQADNIETSAALINKIKERKNNLIAVQNHQQEMFEKNKASAHERVSQLIRELTLLDNERVTQGQIISSAELSVQRLNSLVQEGFVSLAALQEKTEVLATQRARLQSLDRSKSTLERELSIAKTELAVLPMREYTQLSELGRSLASTEQELIELQSRKDWIVVASQAGRVSGLNVQIGQTVIADKPLMTLVPANSTLEVHLFAPSKDAGFTRPGQIVAIRFRAYPYQKFGHYSGRIIDVSKTPLSPSELLYPISQATERTSASLTAEAQTSSSEPVYRIRVALDSQNVNTYGVAQTLQAGSQLEADVMLDTRTLIEWILEPLFSLRGKYFSPSPPGLIMSNRRWNAA